jgi:phosphonate transport system permease protein
MTGDAELQDREVTLRRLAGEQPRNNVLRWSGIALTLLVAYAWATGDFSLYDFTDARRRGNLQRFGLELVPYPLRGDQWSWSDAIEWVRRLSGGRAGQALATTLAMSIMAIVFAGLAALLLTLPATRTLAAPEPYGPEPRAPRATSRIAWSTCVWLTRVLLIFLRSVPEYVWAFLLIAVVGPNVWAAVLALALHNAGILAKLDADVVENLQPETLEGLRALGGSRRQIALVGIMPAAAGRFLLFVFYRWETCVREATVLGMLGVVSIGFFIQDARARQHYDEMFALILAGSLVVLVGDVLSAAARRAVRNSS